MDELDRIPDQTVIPWSVAFSVSWGSLRRRFFRSLITMAGVILAIAFLTYMLVTDDVTNALILVNQDQLNILLQKADVDIIAATGTDKRMMLLIGLSLFTCLVGIINSMLMSVTERIREIGTMKCLGALSTFILKIYFIESALQGVIGTLIGLLVGFVVGFGISVHSFHGYVWQYLPVVEILKSLGISAVIGALISVVAAIAPAQWASAKEPVDAMRVEQ
ncbi:MAG: hypothetical protein A2498_15355 [Lentisphaerae bacterium RIFOXYC12_FULL_60_16]|nr:MAG: hypothetical protein A2498_15355 [Lentisphaerae bacterium RIFOXYC12_FULL_60_16]OGV72396.1 MAG: hypothetical protein A2269_03760 [Lentisphaerae bacterium RIFOXYA12_FULL_60_10]OGV78552.1 MAG: hypothetical protein A2340_12120 [Lentisphaerae bacterium RIFOXYB12_FULL_60_10]